MSKTKNVVIDDLNKKQETIKYLTELMATVQMAHFKGRLGEHNGDDTGSDGAICGELLVHEGDDLHPVAISIDLYHFEGDGEDVCDGLHGVTPYHGEDTESETGWVFNMGYDPDDEYPLYFCFHPDDDSEDYTILPQTLPVELLQSVTAWLEGVLQRMPRIITTKRGCFRIEDDGETLQAVKCNDSSFCFTFAHGTTDAEMIEDIEKEFDVNNNDGDEE